MNDPWRVWYPNPSPFIPSRCRMAFFFGGIFLLLAGRRGPGCRRSSTVGDRGESQDFHRGSQGRYHGVRDVLRAHRRAGAGVQGEGRLRWILRGLRWTIHPGNARRRAKVGLPNACMPVIDALVPEVERWHNYCSVWDTTGFLSMTYQCQCLISGRHVARFRLRFPLFAARAWFSGREQTGGGVLRRVLRW